MICLSPSDRGGKGQGSLSTSTDPENSELRWTISGSVTSARRRLPWKQSKFHWDASGWFGRQEEKEVQCCEACGQFNLQPCEGERFGAVQPNAAAFNDRHSHPYTSSFSPKGSHASIFPDCSLKI